MSGSTSIPYTTGTQLLNTQISLCSVKSPLTNCSSPYFWINTRPTLDLFKHHSVGTASWCSKVPYCRRLVFNTGPPKWLLQLSQSFLHILLCRIYQEQTGKKKTLQVLLKNPITTFIWSWSAGDKFGRLMDGNRHGIVRTQAMESNGSTCQHSAGSGNYL